MGTLPLDVKGSMGPGCKRMEGAAMKVVGEGSVTLGQQEVINNLTSDLGPKNRLRKEEAVRGKR